MMPQQGPLPPPPRGMNMPNGSHGHPMNPMNQNMMQGEIEHFQYLIINEAK